MTDNSKIVLRWEIDNAAARLATGKAKSGVFNEAGFKWVAGVVRFVDNDGDTVAKYILRCDVDHNIQWKCETIVEVTLLHLDGRWRSPFSETRFIFNENNREWFMHQYKNVVTFWREMENHNVFRVNDKITVEFRIKIVSCDRGQSIADPSMFDAPNRRSDVILKIGEKKLHVSKEFLSVHSPVFETLFFGDFAENGKEEVEIKDVIYEEFLDLLHYIYLGTGEISDHTVPHILKLADQFQMEKVVELAKKHLTQSKGIDVMTKLLLADRYNIDSLRDQCLASFTSKTDLAAKLNSPECADFSLNLKGAIFDRLAKL